MNWDALGAIGEIFGAGAVVVTLIYLSRQLRQNTEALRSAAWQATQEAEHRFDSLFAQDREISAIFIRGWEGGKAAFEDDEVAALQWWLIAKQLLELFQTHHYQHELGLVEEEWWQTWVSQYDESMASPGFREFVEERYPVLRSSFRAFVDAHPYRGEVAVNEPWVVGGDGPGDRSSGDGPGSMQPGS